MLSDVVKIVQSSFLNYWYTKPSNRYFMHNFAFEIFYEKLGILKITTYNKSK